MAFSLYTGRPTTSQTVKKKKDRVVDWAAARRSSRVLQRMEKCVQAAAAADATSADAADEHQQQNVGDGIGDSDVEMTAYVEPRLKRKNSRLRAPTVAERLDSLRLSRQLGKFPSYAETAAANRLLASGISNEHLEQAWLEMSGEGVGGVNFVDADGTNYPVEFIQRASMKGYVDNVSDSGMHFEFHNSDANVANAARDDLLARYNEACLAALKTHDGVDNSDGGVTVTLHDDELVSLLLAQHAAATSSGNAALQGLAEESEEGATADASNFPQQNVELTVENEEQFAEDEANNIAYLSVRNELANVKDSYVMVPAPCMFIASEPLIVSENGNSVSIPASRAAENTAKMLQKSLVNIRPKLQAASSGSLTTSSSIVPLTTSALTNAVPMEGVRQITVTSANDVTAGAQRKPRVKNSVRRLCGIDD